MIYKDFNNIDIESEIGVSPVGEDTKLLAKYVKKLNFHSALEIGTGTGFITIYLKSLGYNCIGTDINENAIKCSMKNAQKNKVHVTFLISDLFNNVKNKYELIIFNPPYGNVRSSFLTKYVEVIKSLLPKENLFIAKISYPLIKKQRRALLRTFFQQASSFLKKKGKIIIYLHKKEMDLIKNQQFKILDHYKDLNLALLVPFDAKI